MVESFDPKSFIEDILLDLIDQAAEDENGMINRLFNKSAENPEIFIEKLK